MVGCCCPLGTAASPFWEEEEEEEALSTAGEEGKEVEEITLSLPLLAHLAKKELPLPPLAVALDDSGIEWASELSSSLGSLFSVEVEELEAWVVPLLE